MKPTAKAILLHNAKQQHGYHVKSVFVFRFYGDNLLTKGATHVELNYSQILCEIFYTLIITNMISRNLAVYVINLKYMEFLQAEIKLYKCVNIIFSLAV
jgi:hypothetical protein